MTNENIIKQLKRLIPSLQYADDVNAVKGAIQALSQEPTVTSTDEPMTMVYPTIVCDDAINRQAVKDILNNSYSLTDAEHSVEQLPSVTQKCEKCAMNGSGSKYCDNCTPYNKGFDEGLEQGFRAIGAEVRQSGKWIDREEYDVDRWKCSECGRTQLWKENYCPNCGRRMVEPQESSEDELKDLSKRVETLEKQMKEDKEEQLKKLKAELDYAKFRCTL